MTQIQENKSGLPEGWIEVTLEELIEGWDYKIKNNLRKPLSSNVRQGIQWIYPYYWAAGIIDYINDFKVDWFNLIIAEDWTVTTNWINPMLQLVNWNFWVSNHAHILQWKDEWQTKFLYYLLSNININPYITWAVQLKLSKQNLLRVNFNLPKSKVEQKTITKILSSIDNKISLLKEQNETLEKIWQEIFKELFGKYKVWDELPDGWKVGKISDFWKVICWKTPSKNNQDFYGWDIPFIKIPDMHNEVFISETTDSLTKEWWENQKNKFIPKNSICVSCIATVWLVWITTKKSQTNQQINSIILNETYFLEYLFFTLRNMKNELIWIWSWGSATLNINTSTFSNIELLFPESEILKSFNEKIKPLFEKIKGNNLQIQTLSKTRDELLPKLMKWEVLVDSSIQP